MADDANEDPLNPFGDDDEWALSLFQKTFFRMNVVLTELSLGTVNKPQKEKVPNYADAFHLLTDNPDKLLGTLKPGSKEVAATKEVVDKKGA